MEVVGRRMRVKDGIWSDEVGVYDGLEGGG